MNISNFGEKISMYRQNRNMTQEELAMRISVTPQAVSRWERNQSLPDIAMLADLCRILNVSADVMLDIECGQVTEDNDSKVSQEVMKVLRSCDEPLELVLGEGLVKLFMEEPYTDYVARQRRILAQEGILLPVMRVRDGLELEANEVRVLSYHKIIYQQVISEITENTCQEMISALSGAVRKNYGHILNTEIVKMLIDNLKIKYSALIEGVVPEKISYGLLLDVLRQFVSRGNTLIHLMKLIEYIEHALRKQPDLTAEALAEQAESWLEETIEGKA